MLKDVHSALELEMEDLKKEKEKLEADKIEFAEKLALAVAAEPQAASNASTKKRATKG